MNWSRDDQRAYINAQLVMASTIVARAKPEMAQCMADEFYSDTGLTDVQHNQFLAAVEEYSSYHPSTVFVVVIEGRCGAFF